MNTDAARDVSRREIAARGLTPEAVTHLTRDALGRVDLEQLAPLKQLLKRFFSDAPWSAADDDAIAAIAGSGSGWWQYGLTDGFGLAFGWRDGTFRIDVSALDATTTPAAQGERSLADSFAGAVVPEATPNPRTIRFVTGSIHDGASRWYESAEDVDDPRVARLFATYDAVANVLVGPGFVAVGVKRPNQWEALLAPMLHAIEATFVPTDGIEARERRATPEPTMRTGARAATPAAGAPRHSFDDAWRRLSRLDPAQADDLARVRAAALSDDRDVRHVAARLFERAEPDDAHAGWSALLDDSSRTVRRAVVDAMVDTARESLRPLLERALADPDAWTRWKALRGLVELGIDPSRACVLDLAEDPDFRVRLEATGALRR